MGDHHIRLTALVLQQSADLGHGMAALGQGGVLIVFKAVAQKPKLLPLRALWSLGTGADGGDLVTGG